MTQNIHYHSKRRNQGIVRKYWNKVRSQPSRANSKFYSSMSLMSKGLDGSVLSALLTAIPSPSWASTESLFVAPLGR